MNFGEAIRALKAGEMVKRDTWREHEFIFRQIPANISKNIVPNMQSLPSAVKDEFARRFNDSSYQMNEIYYDDQLAFVNESNLITGYAPSPADALAEDWFIYEERR